MAKIRLMPRESVIATFGENVILTDHRIYMNEYKWGHSSFTSIFLEDISSIQRKYRSKIVLLLIAALFFLAGIYFMSADSYRYEKSEISGRIFVVGVIFVLVWLFTRKNVVCIASDGNSALEFETSGISDDKLDGFIHEVSIAKQNRMIELSTSSSV